MKITYNSISNTTYVNVYISVEESNTPEVLHEIDKLKKQYKHIALFTSGDKPYKETLVKALLLHDEVLQ